MSGYDPWEKVRRDGEVTDAVAAFGAIIMVILLVITIVLTVCGVDDKQDSVQDNNTTATVATVHQETTNMATPVQAITIVTIYNSDGDIMGQYRGVSNVEQKDGYILFYDENGKKNTILLSEGTYANILED